MRSGVGLAMLLDQGDLRQRPHAGPGVEIETPENAGRKRKAPPRGRRDDGWTRGDVAGDKEGVGVAEKGQTKVRKPRGSGHVLKHPAEGIGRNRHVGVNPLVWSDEQKWTLNAFQGCLSLGVYGFVQLEIG